jgi:hypothetical protein
LPVLQPEARIITVSMSRVTIGAGIASARGDEALVLRTIFIASPVDLIGSI